MGDEATVRDGTIVAASSASPASVGRTTLGRRLRAAFIIGLTWLACRLPEPPLIALTDLAGSVWYRLGGQRRRRAERNLGLVTRWMATNRVGSDRGRAAASDQRAFATLVRDAFRHLVRYNIVLARGATMDAEYVRSRFVLDTPGATEWVLGGPPGPLFVGLHMGSMELPAYYLSGLTGRTAVAPVERLRDPLLQSYMVASRLRMGLRLVELHAARRELVAGLRQGDPAGIAGDRDLTGGGIEVQFFGAPASLPVGPALIAMEAGVTPNVFGIRRTADGRYHARIVRIAIPDEGTRRERVTAYLAAEAHAFERLIAEAPEQWFAVFFPIWGDAVLDEALA